MCLDEYLEVISLSYFDYCEYLKQKYGSVPYKYGNRKNNLTSDGKPNGLFTHHIGEIEVTALSEADKIKNEKYYSYQNPEMLVYCNFLEHLLLHIKIGQEADINREEQLGLGGPFKWIIPAIEKYYFTGLKDYSNEYYYCLDENKEVYELLVDEYNETVKNNDIVIEQNAFLYEQMREKLSSKNKALVVLGTGLGKTTTALQYLYENKCRALVIVPNKTIKTDWCRYGDWVNAITYQTFANKYKSIEYTQYGIVIIDEAHHAGFDEENDKGAIIWGKAIQYLVDKKIKLLGLTATPKRADGIDIRETLFNDCVCEGRSIEDAIENGDVHPFNYITSVYDAQNIVEEEREKILCLDDEELKTTLVAQLDLALNDVPAVYDILNKYIKNNNRRGIIFVQDIADMDIVLNIFKKALPNAEIKSIHSDMNPEVVDENRKWFADENTRGYLMAINMVSEGVHYPQIDTIIMFRRTQSFLVYTQQIGRIITLATKENPNAIVFDLVNNINSIRYNDKVVDNDREYIPRIRDALRNTETFKSGQIIVADESADFVNRIRKIKDRVSGIWTEEEDNILREFYPIEGSGCYIRLAGRTRMSVLSRASQLEIKAPDLKWTEEEYTILRKWFPIEGPDCYTRFVERTRISVIGAARRLNIKMNESSLFWTEEEDAILKEWYPIEGGDCYKRLCDRTKTATAYRAQKLGIKAPDLSWTEDEESILKQWYPIEGKKCNIRLHNKTENSVIHRASKLGIKSIKTWAEEDDDILREWYPKEGSECHKRLCNRTEMAVGTRARKLGIKAPDLSWSNEEDEIIKKYYPIEGKKCCKRMPNRSESAVMSRASGLGIKLQENWSKEADNIILQWYPTEGSLCAKRLPGKSRASVRARASKLGVKMEEGKNNGVQKKKKSFLSIIQ